MADSSRTVDEDFPVPIERPAGSSMVVGSTAAGAEASAATPSSPSTQTHALARGQARAQQKGPRPCKFYATKAGCKNGTACPYLHDPGLRQGSGDDRSAARVPGASKQDPAGDRQLQKTGAVRHAARGASNTDALAARRHLPTVDPSRVVRRPTPTGENTPEVRRENEINQLKRRWGSLFEQVDQVQGRYRLELKQSEDFPYDLDALRIEIFVPLDYPRADSDGPTIKVLNEDIPRGHQFNIERGFLNSVKSASKTTRLLDLLNNLDKNLESFLSSEKAPTFKIVPNVGAVTQEIAKLDVNDHQAPQLTQAAPKPQVVQRQDPPRPVYSEVEKEVASARRALETRQLEARFRQSTVFWRNATGTTYKVPLEPRMRNMLPAGLLLLQAIDIKVPELYPLEPCRIAFDRSFPKSITASVERNFVQRAQEKPEASLMAQLNYLAQNMHNMIEIDPEPEPEPVRGNDLDVDIAAAFVSEAGPSKPTAATLTAVPDKPHVIIVETTRPPEWEHDSDSDSEEYSGTDEEVEETGEASQAVQQKPEEPEPVSTIERGTSISFPNIVLKNIELLELKTINITMKCTRCKTVADINNITEENSYMKITHVRDSSISRDAPL
ncbi:hypothetical protein ABW20_dc0106838 [Dactylellina cionopaga]|nr:hypothetical protein ABW20_dc0106838 [Dactylellina cionopaga]